MRIGASTIVENERIDIMPHWLEHYARWCSPSDMYVIGDRRLCKEKWMRILVEGFGANYVPWKFENNTADVVSRHRNLTYWRFRWDGWHFNVDCDEFFDPTVDVSQLTEQCDEEGKKVVMARMVDMVGPNHTFPPFPLPDKSPFDIYTEEVDITKGISNALDYKACLLRNPLFGHHNPDGGIPKEKKVGLGAGYKLYHFKWDAQAIDRLDERWKYKEGFTYWFEIKKQANHMRRKEKENEKSNTTVGNV